MVKGSVAVTGTLGATPPITLEAIKPILRLEKGKRREESWEDLFSKIVLVVCFEAEMKHHFGVYEALVDEFVKAGTTDIRCIKMHSNTPSLYNKYPVRNIAKKRFFKKYSWNDNYPKQDSVFCVLRLLTNRRDVFFIELWNVLREHCKNNNVREYLITPTKQGVKDEPLGGQTNVIFWERSPVPKNMPVRLKDCLKV